MRRLALLVCSAHALVTPLRHSTPLLRKQPAFHRPTVLHAFDEAVVAAFDLDDTVDHEALVRWWADRLPEPEPPP